jgi:mitochondrial import receptor subunit TOM40
MGNPDLIHGSGVAVFHYLRSITRNLSLGAEFAYQASPQLPGGHIGVVSLAGRYATDDSSLALTVGNSGQLHASYYQKCSSNLQIGAEMETNFKMQESTASVGYEVDIAKGNFLLRGSVDSNFMVKSVIEKKLLPLPFTLALCSMINHRKNQYQFGCGLIIG